MTKTLDGESTARRQDRSNGQEGKEGWLADRLPWRWQKQGLK